VTNRLPVEDHLTSILASFPPPVRVILLEVLAQRDAGERARRIGELWADDQFRPIAELLIDLEAEPAARALIVGGLRELNA
jgi:hypothetical protein